MPSRNAISELPTAYRPQSAAGAVRLSPVSRRVVPARWLWPHLLSLDAPLVAVVWQRWWARSLGVRLFWSQELILGLGVWLIYLADRLADAAADVSGGHQTARHVFYRQRHARMLPVAVSVLIGLVILSPGLLPMRQFLAGLGLLTLAGGYFWMIHQRTRRGWSRQVPKEAVVGGMFALGTAFFVREQAGQAAPELLLALPLFGCLCFFNCALITKWERSPPDVRDAASLLNAFPRLTARLGAGCLILVLLALAFGAILPRGSTFAPIAISALLLLVLDRQSEHLSPDALRVLADAALLPPLLFLIIPALPFPPP